VNYWDQQYNPRLAVQDSQQYFDHWRARARQARATLTGSIDAPYGEHERERLDVFRAAAPRGTLVFLHGGYWRAFGKEDFSWIATSFVQAGITVVIPSYPLCPGAPLPAICQSVAKAMSYIASSALTAAERERVVLAGHSAGAHLAAHYLSRFATEMDSTINLAAVVCISGVFDLLPLLHAQFLDNMGWDAAGLHEVSPLYRPVPDRGKVILAVGEAESRDFHRQSERLADAWAERCTGVLSIPDQNHFSVLDTLSEPDSLLARLMLDLFEPASLGEVV
jgi:arylformamidase